MIKRIVLFLMAIAILIALGIVLSPMVVGSHIKNHYSQILAKLFPGEKVRFTLLSYQRGWYTDYASVQVDLSQSGWSVNGQDKLILKQVIDVGPILRQPNGGYAWQLARITSHYQQGKTTYQGKVLLDLHKAIVAESTLNHVILSKNAKTTELAQVDMQLNSKPGMKDMHATLGSLTSWSGSEGHRKPSFTAAGIHLHETVTGQKPNAENSMTIDVDKLSMGSDPKKQIHASGARVQRITREHGDSVAVNYRLSAKKLSIGAMPTRTAELDFTVNDLSKTLMKNLMRDITAFLQPGHASDQWGIMQDLVKVLTRGLTLTINKALMSTANGPILFSGTISLPASTQLTGILNPLAQLQAELHGKVPLQWLLAEIMSHQKLQSKKQAARRVADWTQAGLLRLEGKELLFSLTYKHGQFYLSTPDHRKLTRFYWVKQPHAQAGHSN